MPAAYIEAYPLAVKKHFLKVLMLLGFLTLAILLAGCLIGSAETEWRALPAALADFFKDESSTLTSTLLKLRIERVLGAFLTGALLSVAGVMMQALLRNPLADPYVLGVSGGASVGALCMLLLGGTVWMIHLSAFAGALLVAAVLYLLASRGFKQPAGQAGSMRLLLTGVILSFACGAVVTLLLSFAPDGSLRNMIFWLVGDLSGVNANLPAFCILLLVLAAGIRLARSFNLLAMFADEAGVMGVNVGFVRKVLFICAALATAAAVSNAGNVTFIGLIVPHFCRLHWGNDQRLLLPAAVLAGGSFLVLADLLARTLTAPQQLPVGAITVLIGVPVFLFQLYRVKA